MIRTAKCPSRNREGHFYTFIHYNKLIEKSKNNINVFLDDDALSNAKKIYKLFSNIYLFIISYILPIIVFIIMDYLFRYYRKKSEEIDVI